MLKTTGILFVWTILCGSALALDPFDGVSCNADIPKSLTGKHDSNQRVAVLEKHHKNLGLKNLGGDEISDDLFLASWRICGSEYELLISAKNNLIRDVLLFPAHSAAAPMFIGACQQSGRELPGTIVAVLSNSSGYDPKDAKLAKTMLKPSAAWKIDTVKEKFAKQSTDNLACPLNGIVTQDGAS